MGETRVTMSRHRVDREAIRKLLERDVPYGDIATEVGCSYRTVASAAQEMGFSRAQLDHSAALPWTIIGKDHARSVPASNMRELSRIIQGDKGDPYKRAHAILWAQKLVAKELDVSYAPDTPPSEFSTVGGFFTVDATGKDPLETHIGKLLDEAMQKYQR